MVSFMGLVTLLCLLRKCGSSQLLVTNADETVRTLICIPVGGLLLPAIGPTGFVAFFGSILVLSLISFMIARWACLDYKWSWSAKI